MRIDYSHVQAPIMKQAGGDRPGYTRTDDGYVGPFRYQWETLCDASMSSDPPRFLGSDVERSGGILPKDVQMRKGLQVFSPLSAVAGILLGTSILMGNEPWVMRIKSVSRVSLIIARHRVLNP